MDDLAKRYFTWRFAHPWRSTLVELPVALLGVVLFWLLFGRTAALVYAVIVVVLEVLSLPSKIARHRAASRG